MSSPISRWTPVEAANKIFHDSLRNGYTDGDQSITTDKMIEKLRDPDYVAFR